MRDARILRPCPICGEAEHLQIDEGAFEREAVVDGRVVDSPDQGNPYAAMEYVDSIHCRVCLTMAALDCWNGTRPAADLAAYRAEYLEEPEAERVAA